VFWAKSAEIIENKAVEFWDCAKIVKRVRNWQKSRDLTSVASDWMRSKRKSGSRAGALQTKKRH
jgi:hypothetical protein